MIKIKGPLCMFLTFSTWLQSHVLILLYEMVFSLFTNPGSLGSLCIIFDIQLLSYLCAYNPLETRAFTSVCTSLSFWLITLVYFRNFYSICWSQPQLPSLYFFPSPTFFLTAFLTKIWWTYNFSDLCVVNVSSVWSCLWLH